MNRRRLLAFATVLGLAACATAPPPPSLAPTVDHFRFLGRLTLAQGEHRHPLAIDWQHVAARDEIMLSTPLGQTLAALSREGNRFHLRLADGRHFTATDAESLARELLGIPLPLDEARHALFSATGDEYKGWRIIRREHDAFGLPRRLEIRREAIVLHLIIDAWESPP